jgi:hypothetical protein
MSDLRLIPARGRLARRAHLVEQVSEHRLRLERLHQHWDLTARRRQLHPFQLNGTVNRNVKETH